MIHKKIDGITGVEGLLAYKAELLEKISEIDRMVDFITKATNSGLIKKSSHFHQKKIKKKDPSKVTKRESDNKKFTVQTDAAFLTHAFFNKIQEGMEVKLSNGKSLHVLSRSGDRANISIDNTSMYIHYVNGSWYTSLKSKKITKQDKIFNSFWKDVEGEIIMNLINENNPLHNPTDVYNISKMKTI